jgi:oxidase EvaA
MMKATDLDLLGSALCDGNWGAKSKEFLQWFNSRRDAHNGKMQRVSLRDMKGWKFDQSTGNLGHESGRFFKVEGVWIETNFGAKRQWTQPIINQPEIGILGVLTRKIDGVLHFLMHVKSEPGNIGIAQLAPTLQATRSNFTCAHKGRPPAYLEYFLEADKHRVLVDALQSEQGARFLRKRNRNIILELSHDVPLQEDFCWLTLGQIHRLMQSDNLVNMCTRSVLACISFGSHLENGLSREQAVRQALAPVKPAALPVHEPVPGSFQARVLESELDSSSQALHSEDEILSWFTDLKFRYELNVERMPLKYVQDWTCGEEISHRDGKFFSVVGVRFDTSGREVASWAQPLIQQRQEGIVAFIVKEIKGVLHFLVQGKVEPGNFDVVELAATIQCVTGSYRDASKNECPPFFEYVLNADPSQIRCGAMQSEEGGRFFQEQNLNAVIEADGSFPTEVPPNFIWMTLRQLKQFIRYNNFVNAQARCLLSCVSLCQERTYAAHEDPAHGLLGSGRHAAPARTVLSKA